MAARQIKKANHSESVGHKVLGLKQLTNLFNWDYQDRRTAEMVILVKARGAK